MILNPEWNHQILGTVKRKVQWLYPSQCMCTLRASMFHLALRCLPFTGPTASSKSSVHLEHSGTLNRLYSKLICPFHSCEVAACQNYGYRILWGHANMKILNIKSNRVLFKLPLLLEWMLFCSFSNCSMHKTRGHICCSRLRCMASETLPVCKTNICTNFVKTSLHVKGWENCS